MAGTIDMQRMRYINLFAKVSRIPTTHCFDYNNQIFFAVPKSKVSLAIGKGAENVKKISSILRKRIKVVAMSPKGSKEGILEFVKSIISPIEVSGIEVKGNQVVISAGRQSKAALIGRNRSREKELADVLKNFFHIGNLRIA